MSNPPEPGRLAAGLADWADFLRIRKSKTKMPSVSQAKIYASGPRQDVGESRTTHFTSAADRARGL